MDWCCIVDAPSSINNEESESLVLVQHGFMGSGSSDYMYHLMEKLMVRKYQVVALIARGCGGLDITTKSFVKRKTSDIKEVIDLIRSQKKCVRNIYLVGFSLGGAMTLKYMGDYKAETGVRAAVAVSPPWNLERTSAVFPVWSMFVVLLLKVYIFQHRRLLHNTGVSLTQALLARNLSELDRLMIRLYGYGSIREYYLDTSPIYSLGSITAPTLAISAQDDPMVCSRCSPTAGDKVHPMGPGLIVLKTHEGGHCSFPTRHYRNDSDSLVSDSWADLVILEWLKANS